MILNKKKNLIPTKSTLKIKKKVGHLKTPTKSGKNQILIKTSNNMIENPASFSSPVSQGQFGNLA